MDDEFDELVKKGKKTQKEVEGMKQLANEIQYAIVTRKLRPGKFFLYTVIRDRSEGLIKRLVSHENFLQPNSFPASRKRHRSNLARYRAYHGSGRQL